MHVVRLREANALRGELVKVRRNGLRISVTPEMRTDVFATDPQDVRSIVRQSGQRETK